MDILKSEGLLWWKQIENEIYVLLSLEVHLSTNFEPRRHA